VAYHLNEEQRMIGAMVRDFARETLLPTASERDKTGEFPRENLNKMAELGLMGMNVPPEYRGAGVDTVSYSLALQETSYACASTAVIMSVHNSVACGPIYLFGSDYLKETYLKPLAAGEKIGSFALTEPGAGSDPASQKASAQRDGDTYVLKGNKNFITTGKNSDLTVVTAYTDKTKKHRGISAFVVEKGTPGFHVGKEEDKLGLRASDTVELIFEDCRIPRENLLGEDSYAKERVQFGRPISQFQGIRWMISDMATELEAARLLTFNAAAMKDRGENFTEAASMAKVFASEMANRVAYQALQIHGGYGYMKEFPVERHYRDARVFTLYEGTSEIQRKVIANHVIGRQR